MKLTPAPWKTRALSTDEMLVLAALHYLTPIIDEIRSADSALLDRMIAQRSWTAAIAKHAGLEQTHVAGVLRALERKGLIESRKPATPEAAPGRQAAR
jgi:DNA-binding MarR family transcriptional regulator